jgi:hypothetical protein
MFLHYRSPYFVSRRHISVGFSAADVRLSRLPGWEKRSWGYHGDDGRSFAAEKNGTPYGPSFGSQLLQSLVSHAHVLTSTA